MEERFTKDFLFNTWLRSQGEWVFMPTRNGAWDEGPLKHPTITEVTKRLAASRTLNEDSPTDIYFTPLCFRSDSRKNEYCGTPGVLFADLDTVEVTDVYNFLPPTAIWQTSTGNTQALWYLKAPFNDMDQWRSLNRDLTYTLGADKGGWMQNKVLRIPSSRNWKRDGEYGKWLWYDVASPVSYTFDDLRKRVPQHSDPSAPVLHIPPLPSNEKQGLLEGMWSNLPLSAQYWLTVTPSEYAELRSADRSVLIWNMCKTLHKRGLSAEEIFYLIKPQPWNKWPHDDNRLWQDVIRSTNAR